MHWEVIASPGAEEETWRDIKALWRAPISPNPWRSFLFVGAALLALGLVVFWWLKRPKSAASPRAAVPEKPPAQLALEQIDRLTQQKLWEKSQVEAHYVALSKILRAYLEHQYRFPALESSTSEILRDARQANMPASALTALSDLLRQCDLAKFARSVPPLHYHPQALREARRFIEQSLQDTAHASE